MGSEAVKADQPAGARAHSRSSVSRGALSRKGPTPGFPRGEVLTVDVLDEAGGAGHIVHFELRQGCPGQPRWARASSRPSAGHGREPAAHLQLNCR